MQMRDKTTFSRCCIQVFGRLLPVFLLLGLLAVPAAAQVYKCTEADGSTRYTDTPCDETSTTIRRHAAPPAAASPDERMQKTRRLLDALEAERNQERQAEADRKAEKERREQNCISARDRYQRIVSAGWLYDYDEEGNRVVLSEEERALSTDRARSAVKRWCGD